MPISSLIFDSAGNLYGTTYYGGADDYGTVFELSPDGKGAWREEIIHSFERYDGTYPSASVILDSAGNLYGTTAEFGPGGQGTVFELSPNGRGGWSEQIIHSFGGLDGSYPDGSLIFDSAGNLYGTTAEGGAYVDFGTVFELSPHKGGGWSEKVIHSLSSKHHDGDTPFGSVVFDSVGNLYGTTWQGGNYNDGIVFEITP
jgi:uncharacterized repeat protein (TIGR03803 family)